MRLKSLLIHQLLVLILPFHLKWCLRRQNVTAAPFKVERKNSNGVGKAVPVSFVFGCNCAESFPNASKSNHRFICPLGRFIAALMMGYGRVLSATCPWASAALLSVWKSFVLMRQQSDLDRQYWSTVQHEQTQRNYIQHVCLAGHHIPFMPSVSHLSALAQCFLMEV